MGKIRTIVQLQEELDQQTGWRIKEISTFRLSARKDKAAESTFIRAGIALAYAHWEGFVKSASEKYLSYVQYQGHKYSELNTCFYLFGLKSKIDLLRESNNTELSISYVDDIFDIFNKPTRFNLTNPINTRSNLTSSVFKNIAISINIDIARYETKFHFIDESVVARRNKIAHGEYIDLNIEAFENVLNEVIILIRQYKTDIENAASMKTYKKGQSALRSNNT